MKRIAWMFALTLLAASLALAQEATKSAEAPKPEAKPAALPSVDAVLENYVKALGGKEAIQKATSYTMKGKLELPAMGATGAVETASKAPNKNYMKSTLDGLGDFIQAFDGKVAWSQDPMSGFREMSGAELAAMKIQSDFYRDIRMKELYKTLAVKGREKVGEASTIVVEAVPAEGEPTKYYFDEKTWLVVRMDSVNDSPQGKMPTENYTEDYRMVEGVKLPHRLRIVNPAFALTITIDEIKTNVAVDDAKFAKPAGK